MFTNETKLSWLVTKNMSAQAETDVSENELLTVREAAAYLRVSRVTAWRWCQQGIIPAFRIGRSWRVPRDELLELTETSFDQIKQIS
jgi:excisionase family DNA binding protein